jgi:hypothetical protein
MIHDVFYIISPKPELLRSFGAVRKEVSDVLSLQNLWTGQLADKGIMTFTDAENLTKALFLLSITDMPEVSAAVGAASGGDIEISPEFFDRLWSIERLHEDGNIRGSTIDFADDPRFQKFAKSSGRAIQHFVEEIVSRAVSS